MPGSRHPTQEPAFIALREADIHHLAGRAAFHWADRLQRAGHVRAPTIEEEGLSGEVLGTWRRLDRVTVAVEGGHVRSHCSCRPEDRPGRARSPFCRHGAALLLEWVRGRSSFAAVRATPDPHEVESRPAAQEESPLQEYARLLDLDTAAHLREIARRRGVRASGQYKADLVRNLAGLIGQPESVDAALAGLNEDERVTLYAIDLLAWKGFMRGAIERAYRALGGRGELVGGVPAAVEGLVELGLLIPNDRQSFPAYAYTVPRVVSARLPPRDMGLRPADRPGDRDGGAEPEDPRLGLAEVFQVVVRELQRGAIGVRAPTVGRDEIAGVAPGWRIEGSGWVEGKRGRAQYAGPVRLVPLPPILVAADLNHLHKLTGQPAGAVRFALDLMVALGMVQRKGERLVPRENRLQTFLTQTPTERLASMINAWLGMIDATELRTVVDKHGPLQLYTRLHYGWTQAQPQGGAARRLLARLVGRAVPVHVSGATWHDVDSLLDLLWNVAPNVLADAPGFGAGPVWWFTDDHNPEHSLKLDRPEDWRRVFGPLVTTILEGPMAWLGLMDVAHEGDAAIFRPRPGAALLVGRDDVAAEARVHRALHRPLQVETDPRDAGVVVMVPHGSDGTIYTLLARIGELTEASPHGLRYRLMPELVQAAFDGGMTGPDLIGSLADAVGGTLPEELGATLARWWAGYGTIRLYDELALVELDDDLLLRELLATSSLSEILVQVCSPRVVAIDPAGVDTLLAELTRLGHTPRLMEGA